MVSRRGFAGMFAAAPMAAALGPQSAPPVPNAPISDFTLGATNPAEVSSYSPKSPVDYITDQIANLTLAKELGYKKSNETMMRTQLDPFSTFKSISPVMKSFFANRYYEKKDSIEIHINHLKTRLADELKLSLLPHKVQDLIRSRF